MRLLACPRVATVESTDPHGEDDVEGLFAGLQSEVLRRDLANAHPSCGDLLGRLSLRLGDRPGRSIDGEDVARDEASCHGSRGGTRTAPDLEDARVRLERQRFHDLSEAR